MNFEEEEEEQDKPSKLSLYSECYLIPKQYITELLTNSSANLTSNINQNESKTLAHQIIDKQNNFSNKIQANAAMSDRIKEKQKNLDRKVLMSKAIRKLVKFVPETYKSDAEYFLDSWLIKTDNFPYSIDPINLNLTVYNVGIRGTNIAEILRFYYDGGNRFQTETLEPNFYEENENEITTVPKGAKELYEALQYKYKQDIIDLFNFDSYRILNMLGHISFPDSTPRNKSHIYHADSKDRKRSYSFDSSEEEDLPHEKTVFITPEQKVNVSVNDHLKSRSRSRSSSNSKSKSRSRTERIASFISPSETKPERTPQFISPHAVEMNSDLNLTTLVDEAIEKASSEIKDKPEVIDISESPDKPKLSRLPSFRTAKNKEINYAETKPRNRKKSKKKAQSDIVTEGLDQEGSGCPIGLASTFAVRAARKRGVKPQDISDKILTPYVKKILKPHIKIAEKFF